MIVATSNLFASDLKGNLPIEGGLHFQEHGWTGISFFYSAPDLTGKQVKIQISTSSRFNKIEREFYPKGRSYFWRCELTGRIYWRLVLRARDGKTLATTPVKYFVVVPPPVTTIPLTQGSHRKFSTRGIDFQWSEAAPRVVFYRYKLAKDKTFDHPLINVDIKKNSHHVEKLDAGHYFWKVGVKYSHSVPIVYSAIREFILQPTASPKITVIPSEEIEKDDELDAPAEPQPAAKISPLQQKPSPTPAPIGSEDGQKKPHNEKENSAPGEKPIAPDEGNHAKASATISAKPADRPATEPPPTPPLAPDLTSPPDKAQIETFEEEKSLMLQWTADKKARKFTVEIARNGSLSEASRLTCEPMRISVTLQAGQYYWRVTASDEHGIKGAPSPIMSFEIVHKKIGVVLISPEKDREFTYNQNSPPITFSWSAETAKNDTLIYEVQIARDGGFSHLLKDLEARTESITMQDLADGRYSWRVGAKIAKEAPLQYSAGQSFSIVRKTVKTDPPKLTAPDDNARVETASEFLPVAFKWNPPERSRGFIIEIATDQGFKNVDKFSSLNPSMDIKRKVGRYFWRVRALNEAGEEGENSGARAFSVEKARKSIELKEPAPSSSVGSFKVHFNWLALDGCRSYRLKVSANNTMDNLIRDIETTDTSAETKLDDEDTYFWSVSCKRDDGQTIDGETRLFRIVISG